MSYIANAEWLAEVAKGNVPGHALVHKFGRNPTCANNSWEIVAGVSTSYPFRSSASTMQIKSGGSVNDVASTGSHAREVTIQGIDSSFNEVTETIATNGSSASLPTSTSFWRVHRAWVSEVGVYGNSNENDIVIEDSGSTNDLLIISAGEGQTQFGGWSVPTGKTAYFMGADLTLNSTKDADFRVMVRQRFDIVTPSGILAPRIQFYWEALDAPFTYRPNSPAITIPALSDVYVEVNANGTGVSASVDFELLIVDD